MAKHNTAGENEKCSQHFRQKHQGKRPPGRHKRRWKNDIKLYLKEIGWYGVNLIQMAHHAVM